MIFSNLLISQNQFHKKKYEITYFGKFTEKLELRLKINKKLSSPKTIIYFQICITKNSSDSLIILNNTILHCWCCELNVISKSFYDDIWSKLPKGSYKIRFNEIHCNETRNDDNIIYIPSIFFGIVEKK
jgi:hypothetical protein